MEILSIIPARGGSKRIKRKNLLPLLDKPLIAYTIEASLKSKYITRTLVSSEDEEILEVSKFFGADIIKRPLELAQDETKTAPVMLNCLENLEKEGYRADWVVLLQPTSPLRDEKYIDCAFDYLFEKQKEGFDSCFSAFQLGVCQAKWRINKDSSLFALYDYRKRPRWQETNEHCPLIGENGAFYALKWDTLKEVKDFIGYNPCAYITPSMIDIDTKEDFKKVENILRSKK